MVALQSRRNRVAKDCRDGTEGKGLEAAFVEHRAQLLRFMRARSLDDPDDLLNELRKKVAGVKVEAIANPLSYLYRMANELVLDRSVFRMSRDAERYDLLTASLYKVSESDWADRFVMVCKRLSEIETTNEGLGERTAQIFHRLRSDGVSQQETSELQGLWSDLVAIIATLPAALMVYLSR